MNPSSHPRSQEALDKALRHAVAEDRMPEALSLIRIGADPRSSSGPDEKHHEGTTALMIAAARDEPRLAAMLLPLSDPLALNAFGDQALSLAAWFGSPGCCALLIPCSDLLRADSGGWTPLEMALSMPASPRREECAAILLAALDLAGASFDASRAFELCARHGFAACAESLAPRVDLTGGAASAALASARANGWIARIEPVVSNALAVQEKGMLDGCAPGLPKPASRSL